MKCEDIDIEEVRKMIVWHMEGYTPTILRALSFSFSHSHMPTPSTVVLRAHFFKSPTMDDLCDISVVEGQVYGDFEPGTLDITTEVQIASIGTKLRLLENVAWIDPAEAFRKG